jgi:hypothetical protein
LDPESAVPAAPPGTDVGGEDLALLERFDDDLRLVAHRDSVAKPVFWPPT